MWSDDFVANDAIAAASTSVRLLSPDRSSGLGSFPNTPVTLMRTIFRLEVTADVSGGQVILQVGIGVGDQDAITVTPPNPYTDTFGWIYLDALVGFPSVNESQHLHYDTRARRKLEGLEQALFLVVENLALAATFSVSTRMLWKIGEK